MKEHPFHSNLYVSIVALFLLNAPVEIHVLCSRQQCRDGDMAITPVATRFHIFYILREGVECGIHRDWNWDLLSPDKGVVIQLCNGYGRWEHEPPSCTLRS
jgi:hypothetical protein